MDESARDSTARIRWDASSSDLDRAGFDGLKARYEIDARLRLGCEHFLALPGLHSRRTALPIASHHALIVLESLALENDTWAAFEAYQRATRARRPPPSWASAIPRAPWQDECLQIAPGKLLFVRQEDVIDLASSGADTSTVIVNLLRRESAYTPLCPSIDAFVAAIRELGQVGLIAPRTGGVDWGDLARPEPFCSHYGGSRGTIVDRYYLCKFVHSIQHMVCGRTVEVGTSMLTSENRLSVQFPAVSEYRCLDFIPSPGVDICGDLLDRSLLERNSIDSILCFNVLEHCAEAQRAVDNMLEWLSPGGKAFCMVPSVQRVHDAPNDYWRPMPGGIEHLFRNFSRRQLHVYGNLQTTIAALAALAIEDLSPEVLDRHHPDYPVATCIVATK